MPIDPLLRRVATPYAARFLPMGLPLQVQSNDQAVIMAAEASFGGYGLPSAATDPLLTIRLLVHPVGHGRPDGPPIHRSQGHLCYVAFGAANVAVLDLHQGQAMGFVGAELLDDMAALQVHFLEFLWYSFLQRYRPPGDAKSGFVGIHAACVRRPGEAGLLLRARSGGGKSVLAYACLQRGYQLVAEDVTWLQLERGVLTWLWGAPWLLHLRPDVVALFPELAEVAPVRRPTGVVKLALSLRQRFPTALAVSAPPGALCFLQRHDGRSAALEPVADAAQAAALFAATEGEELDVPHYATGVQELLRRPAYILHAGRDLDATVQLLAGRTM